MDDYTRKFSIAMEKDAEIRHILTTVYQALEEKGYNPINQIVGYILSEDPTYITNHNNARTLIRKIDRDELLQVLVRKYLGQSFMRCVTPRRNSPAGSFFVFSRNCRQLSLRKTLTKWIKSVTIWLQIFSRECFHA